MIRTEELIDGLTPYYQTENATMNLSVLLVEDDRDLAASVADYLSLENISCDHAFNGQAGLTLASENHYDVILLDLMLPRMDGLSVCQHLRDRGLDTPILMLTARDTLADKVAGFRAGTDDYLVKPFAMEELTMRTIALAGRRSSRSRKLAVADLEMDLNQRKVSRAGKNLTLTPSCWTLLETLMRASPEAVSRDALGEALWQDQPPDTDSLKVHMYKLRQQVDKPFEQALIHTVSGHGFALRSNDEA